jgi:hypothetical protein
MVNLRLISLAKTLDAIVLGVPAVMNTVLVMEIIAVMVEEEQMEAMEATLLSVTIEEVGTRASLMQVKK